MRGQARRGVTADKQPPRLIPIGQDRGGPISHGGERLLAGAVGWWDVGAYPGSGQVLPNRGTGGSALDAQFGSTTGTDTNDPQVLPYTGTPYVALPGVAGNYLSAPDAANLRVTGDIDMAFRLTLPVWSVTGYQTIGGRWTATGSQMSYVLGVATPGTLQLNLTTDGLNSVAFASSVVLPFANGSAGWVRATWRASDGRTQFFTAADSAAVPSSWTQLGVDRTIAVGSIFAGTSAFSVGAHSAGASSPLTGTVHRAVVRNGIGGTTVLDVDTSVLTSGGQSSFAALTGQTVTINRSATGRKAVAVVRPLILFGTDDYLTVPDSDLLDFADADSFTVLAVARQHGTQGGYSRLVSKINNGAGWALYNQISTAEVRGYVSDGTLSRFISAGATYPGSALGVSAMVRDRPNALLRLYGNGVQASATTDAGGQLATIANGLAMNIGRTPGGAEYADMEFLAAAVFRRALSATEIAQTTAYYQQRMP